MKFAAVLGMTMLASQSLTGCVDEQVNPADIPFTTEDKAIACFAD